MEGPAQTSQHKFNGTAETGQYSDSEEDAEEDKDSGKDCASDDLKYRFLCFWS